MSNITRNKWQVRLAALAIFLLGFAAGALALNAYRSWAAGHRDRRGDHFERMFDRLQLTDEQKPQVQQILKEAREQLRAARMESAPRVAEIRRQTDERLRQVLTPEQWQQFQQMKNEMRSGKRRKSRRGDGKPHTDER